MNRNQKSILINFVVVIIVTASAVIGLLNFKDWVNRSEAIRAMEHLGRVVIDYRSRNGYVPPQPYVDDIEQQLEGHVRLGRLIYRGRWISIESGPKEILAYTAKQYRASFLEDGYIVLFLDGHVEWVPVERFKFLLSSRQGPEEFVVPSAP